MAEPAVHPHQCPLVVLQVEHDGAVLQRTRLDDHVELLVGQPRGALRDDLHLDLAQRVEEPVPARAEQALELAVAEVETHFVAANLDRLQHLFTFLPAAFMGRSCLRFKKPLGGGTSGDHTYKCGVSFEHPHSLRRHGSFRRARRRRGKARAQVARHPLPLAEGRRKRYPRTTWHSAVLPPATACS